ncbi:hypothetical protein GGR57DRAFT_458088, partial [Xylariaceae sp. FL1272]
MEKSETKKESEEPQEKNYLIIAKAGCTSGQIFQAAKAKDLAVPLGCCPTVGSGEWLQGGIGRLGRQYGLSSDNIVGAVVVSVANGDVLYVGNVPHGYRPPNATRPDFDDQLLWALRGAGTNFAIVVGIVFRTHPASACRNWGWADTTTHADSVNSMLCHVDANVSSMLHQACTVDTYINTSADLYDLRINVSKAFAPSDAEDPLQGSIANIKGQLPGYMVSPTDPLNDSSLFDRDMAVTRRTYGHRSGFTSSFRRCVFLSNIRSEKVANVLHRAMQNRPSQLCHLHLIQGGGAIRQVEPTQTAFGCRDWDFACVVTGGWPCEQNGTDTVHTVKCWVYQVVDNLLPLSSGVYGADLGPDQRDVELAARAFGPNLERLARLKQQLDPCNVLAHACPLPKPPMGQD